MILHALTAAICSPPDGFYTVWFGKENLSYVPHLGDVFK